jgi:hypothetical protein
MNDAVKGEELYSAALRSAESAQDDAGWSSVVAMLREAENCGSARAKSDLAALVSLGAPLAVPPKKILSADPRLAVVNNFVTPELCAHLIAAARPKLHRAQVFDQATGGPRQENVRDNSECHLSRGDGIVPLLVRQRIGIAAELPVAAMEATAILHYAPGERFEPHYDFLDPAQPGPARGIAEAGQRVLTFLVSLNDGYEGGETEFPALGKRYKGRTGTAIFFWNVTPDGAPDRRTVHAGLPPTSGEKWLLSQWIRERTWRDIVPPSP